MTSCISPQIENADDVLIMPLERFRKEQISAAKVRRYYDLTPPSHAGVKDPPLNVLVIPTTGSLCDFFLFWVM